MRLRSGGGLPTLWSRHAAELPRRASTMTRTDLGRAIVPSALMDVLTNKLSTLELPARPRHASLVTQTVAALGNSARRYHLHPHPDPARGPIRAAGHQASSSRNTAPSASVSSVRHRPRREIDAATTRDCLRASAAARTVLWHCSRSTRRCRDRRAHAIWRRHPGCQRRPPALSPKRLPRRP